MNARDRVYTGKVNDWGLPDGTAVVRTDIHIGRERLVSDNGRHIGSCISTTEGHYKIKSLPEGYKFNDDGEIVKEQKGYCIIVEGFSEDKKRRVQDAFSKLGINWPSISDFHNHLDKNHYANVDVLGFVRGNLMYGSDDINLSQEQYLITYEELMKEAGMSEVEEKRYWDGKEPLEVGMLFTTKSNENRWRIECIYNGNIFASCGAKSATFKFEHIKPVDTRTDKEKAVDSVMGELACSGGMRGMIRDILNLSYDKWVGSDE